MSDTSVDQFLEDCGSTGALRLIVEHAGVTTHHCFGQPFVLVGRDHRADLQLDVPQLDRRHAYFQLLGGRLLFVSLQRENGITRAVWLDPGQKVDLGPLSVRLHEDTPVADWVSAGLSRPYAPELLPAISLSVFGRGASTVWRMKRPLALVGNSPGCKIRLDDEEISRFHCGLVKTPKGLWAVDLLSTNGMTVNEAKVRVAPLNDADQLRVGNFTICPRYEAKKPILVEYPSTHAIPIPVDSDSAGGTTSIQTASPVVGVERSSQRIAATWQPNGQLAADATASPLVVQLAQLQQQFFAQMQQQMADQFQQAMGLFVEAFWTMHREQSGLVRRELKRIRRLTEKLTLLQTELGKLSDTPAADQLPHAIRAHRSQQSSAVPSSEPPKPREDDVVSSVTTPESPSGPTKTARAPKPRLTTNKGQSPAEMHAWLHLRVNEIQKQRNSSWQRILNLIQGKSATKTPTSPSPTSPAAG
jgi:pSer/pThr/pTyr-binding forkhead associated (FHA) protein